MGNGPEGSYCFANPYIGVDYVEQKGKIAIGTSRYGGMPDLPEGVEWPAFGPLLPFDTMKLAERKRTRSIFHF